MLYVCVYEGCVIDWGQAGREGVLTALVLLPGCCEKASL